MRYVFNSGRGGVLCDKCNVLIDEDLGYDHAVETYGLGEVLCRKCRELCTKTDTSEQVRRSVQ